MLELTTKYPEYPDFNSQEWEQYCENCEGFVAKSIEDLDEERYDAPSPQPTITA